MTRINDFEKYSREVLLRFSKNAEDSWLVDDAMKGVSIMGGTGSGKTTASGRKLALSFLGQGWGGLVLCAKPDEAEMWKKYCKMAGRKESDVIVFSKDSTLTNNDGEIEKIVFNPIDYEMRRPGKGAGETQNITNIFMNIYRMGNRIASEGDTKEERYWDTALKRCLNRVIELLKLSHQDLSYSNMVKILVSSNNLDSEKFTNALVAVEQNNLSFFKSIDSDNNFCLKCLLDAYYEYKTNEENQSMEVLTAYKLVEDYFVKILPAMGSRTKSVVTESFMGLAEPFLSGLLFKHFSGKTNLFPEVIYKEQKVVILDFPIKEFLDTGIIAQSVFKLLFEQAIERRDTEEYPVPVFLWSDEAQYFINPYDQIFLTTARSSRTATVFLSQNISNYFAMMGSGHDAKSRVDSLMGNLSTKIFHANSDAETNEYASRLIGHDISYPDTFSQSKPLVGLNIQNTTSKTAQLLPQVYPKKFTTLTMGGRANEYQVGAIIFVTGKIWSEEKNYLETSFDQIFNSLE